ncbi:Ankyrin repeat protein 1 [Giardia muris]|uniref:Ankyrin repeat protein 1 n=1 Tax=Giardia muris TaxID=5742 RepID=A0A4Z1T8I1_GIAMU|nr:Ankyrin repeat protein 1 [Giardia muris]|eukprot:TNJ28821.1 Ankyrin repeat protein 1 [Giardia muris]
MKLAIIRHHEVPLQIGEETMFYTPLMAAAAANDLEAAKRSLEKVCEKDEEGRTALSHAAEHGSLECVRLLARWESCFHGGFGVTALMYAAYSGRLSCVHELLSEAGMQTLARTSWCDGHITFGPGITALMLAASRGHLEVIQLLMPYERGMTDCGDHSALWYATCQAHDSTGKRLTDGFIDVVQLLKDETKSFYLRKAPPPAPHYPEIVILSSDTPSTSTSLANSSYLLISPPSPTVPLPPTPVAPILSPCCRRLEKPPQMGLIDAARLGQTDLVKLRLHEIGFRDADGRTALMWAASNGHYDCVSLLKDGEAGLQDDRGWTALMYAAWGGHVGCIRLLLNFEAYIQNYNHEFPMDIAEIAAREGSNDAARCLYCAQLIRNYDWERTKKRPDSL